MRLFAAGASQLRYGFGMTLEFLQQNWAILAASVLGTAITLFVAYRAFENSARGQLQRAVRLHEARRQAATKAQRVADKATASLQKLHAKRDSAKPRHMQEGAEALEDAKALLKISQDQVLIAANHVRKIILDEFPPKRHGSLRAKYLPEDEPEKKPFTF